MVRRAEVSGWLDLLAPTAKVGAVVVAVVLVAGSVVVIARHASPDVSRTVLVVGDSNVLIARDVIEAGFEEDGLRAVISAERGVGIRTGPEVPAVDADAVVVNLGINDAGSLGTPDGVGYATYDEKIDWLMGELNGPVFWTNLPCDMEPEGWRAGCEVVTSALDAATDRWPNLTVVDWASVVEGHADWLNGVHITEPGRVAWTTLVRESI